MVRLACDLTVFVLALVAPWWLAVPIGLALMLFLGAYETIVIGFIIDSIQPASLGTAYVGDFLFTVIFLVAATVTLFLRRFFARSLWI